MKDMLIGESVYSLYVAAKDYADLKADLEGMFRGTQEASDADQFISEMRNIMPRYFEHRSKLVLEYLENHAKNAPEHSKRLVVSSAHREEVVRWYNTVKNIREQAHIRAEAFVNAGARGNSIQTDGDSYRSRKF